VNRLSFAEVLAGLDGVHDKVDEGRRIAWLLPPWEENDWLLWFAPKGEIDPFLTLPADLLLERDQDGSLGKRLLHDRFVLIGGNFPDRDQHFTPLSVWSEKRFSGLFIQAQILAQLLDNEHLYELNWQTYIVLVVAVGVLGVWIGRRDRVSHSDLWIELVIVITLILVSGVAFKFGKFIFPFVSVLVGLLAGMAGGHVIKSVPQDGHAAGGS
jgi:CHASE2 domain-containing sensor protein